MHHKKIEYVDISKSLPNEMWLSVFSHLSPEALLIIALTNKAFKNMARNNFLWEKKSYIHFPHLYNKDIAKADIKWFFQFQRYYKDDYKKVDDGNSISLAFKKKFFPDDIEVNINEIFSLVKEGDLERLKVYKIHLNDLDKKDKSGTTLIEWADKYKHQSILNHFFTLIKKHYLNRHNKFIPTKTDDQSRTLLHWAIFCNQSNGIIRKLINYGCDLNVSVKDSVHIQAIHIACKKGKIEIVKILLKKQPSLLNQPDNFGQTPILWAASRGHADIVDFLATLGADLNQATITNDSKNGYSALHWAAEGGHVTTAASLINHGCDLNASVNEAAHRQAIHIACYEGKIEIVKLILEKQPSLLNQLDNFGQTPILWAASRGYPDIVAFLAALGADLNQAAITNDSRNGYTALHWAAERGYVRTATSLVNHGCDLNARINYGAHMQAIHIACREGRIEIVKLLLEKQPSLLNQIDNYSQTPILWAASRGHADIVDFLAKLGANLNQATISNDSYNGYTALHWAAEGGYVATVQSLLNYNASSLLVCSGDKTPNQVCKNIFIKNLICLDIFIRRLENNEDINKGGYIQFNLFNNAKKIDVSATLDAAHVLKAVMLGNANKSMLDRYKNELNRGELSSIFFNLSHYFPADTSVPFRPMLK